MIVDGRNQRASAAAVEILASGGIALLPCDTMYGICGRVPDTEERIRRLKGRSAGKQFIVLIRDRSLLSEFTSMPVDERLLNFWPGSLTIVVPAKQGGTVALRVPDDEFIRGIVAEVGPIYSTSVNASGSPARGASASIRDSYGDLVDLIVDVGDMVDRLPSTIVDSTSAPYRILRQGATRLPEELTRI